MAAILKSKPFTKIPGDTRRVLTRPATDVTGRRWPIGTIYQPGWIGNEGQVVFVDGLSRRFAA